MSVAQLRFCYPGLSVLVHGVMEFLLLVSLLLHHEITLRRHCVAKYINNGRQFVHRHCQCIGSSPLDTGQAVTNARLRLGMPTILALLPIALCSGAVHLGIAVLARRPELI